MIGVYDSGYGGLTVLRALRAALPQEDFVFLGDSGRAPYGGRDAHTILQLAEQCVERLWEEGCELVVVACHTVSCVGLRHLQQHYSTSQRRILGVTIPAAEAAVQLSQGHVGWLGTTRTIASRTFEVEIRKLAPAFQVSGVAAPLLAPLVEEGIGDQTQGDDRHLARLAIRRYLQRFPDTVDTVVLGCTHYPLLRHLIQAELPPQVRLLDPSPIIAERLSDWLRRHPGFVAAGNGRLRVLCSGDPDSFRHHGALFLGEPLPPVQHVAEEQGRLAHRERPDAPLGQVVRPRISG